MVKRSFILPDHLCFSDRDLRPIEVCRSLSFISFKWIKSGKTLQKTLISIVFIIALLGSNIQGWGQAVGDYGTRYTTNTYNWNTAANWIICATAGTWTGATIATVVPGSGTNVWIRSGSTYTENANPAACNNLYIYGTLDWQRANRLNVSGNLTISNGTISGGRTGILNVSGSFSVPASNTASIQRVTLTVTGTSTISGTVNFATSNLGIKSFYGLVTIASTGVWTENVADGMVFRGGITNNGTFTASTGTHTFNTNNQALTGTFTIPSVAITGITLTNNNSLTVSTVLSGTGGLTQAANATLNIGTSAANFTLTTLTASATGNTVNYYRNGTQTVRAITYYNLTLSGTNAKTITGLSNVSCNLTLSGTASATTAAPLTIGCNLTVGTGTTFATGATNTWTLSVTGSTSVTGRLTLANTATKTFTGDVIINGGGVWNETGIAAINFAGSLTHNGTTFTATTGSHTFSGASKNIAGSVAISIPNTAITGTYTNTNTASLTVSTALSGAGTLTQGTNVTLFLGGTPTISGLVASATGNTVNYNGITDQTIFSTSYYHLTASGSGIKTTPGLPTTVTSISGNLTTSGTATLTAADALNVTGNIVLGSGTTFNAGTYSHTVGGNWSNNGATFNSNTSSITFNGNTAQTIGGTSSSSFSTLIINNSAGVSLGIATNSTTVTLTSGLLTTTSAFILTVTGISPTDITGSSSSYVNGPLARTLPANLISGTYLFPIGKGSYNPFELINANTNAGGTVVITAQVFDANCGGTPGVGLSSLNTNRYWSASFTSGSANFINTLMRLTEYSLGAEDAIGQSATQTGSYDRISDDPPSGNTLISWTTPLTTLGYFAIGNKPIITIAATNDGTEGGSNGLFTLTTTKQFTVTRYINITITGTATNGTDYSSITSPVTFPASQSTVTIPVTITNDFLVEPTETVITTINNGTGYAVGTPSSATVNIFDNDVAGISVSPTSGLTTTEAGGTATFTVVLTSQLTSDVNIGLTSNDMTEGTVSPASLTFTSANWNTPQTVTVAGVDDFVQDGNIGYSIITAPATSADLNYKNLDPLNVSVTNTDNDIAGITVSPTSGLITTEAGGTATFTIVLNSQPTGDVTVGLSSNNTNEGTVSPSSVTFTSANWNTAQTITITGVDDYVVDGTISYTIITSQATSTDNLYNVINPSDVSVSNTDNDVAGFVVSPTSGLYTTELGGQSTFTVVLTSKPSNDVTISLTSDDLTEGTVSPSSLTFTSANWNTPQTVTITGVNDFLDDGDIVYHIITGAAVSSDPNYSGKNPSDVTVTNTDNDTAGITINPTSGLSTTEAGGTASFTIVLNTQPTNNVTIGLSSSNTNEGTVSPLSVIFTNGNWNVSQTITITGVNDFIDDGNIAYTIITAAAVSSDLLYSGVNPQDVSVTNIDDDVSGITVSPTSGLTTTEAGGTATFTIVLTSQPTASVTIGLSSNDLTEGTVSPASVTFTAADWNSVRTVTITGENDDVQDGNILYSIVTAAASSTDPLYNGMNPSDVSVTNTDNDVAGFTFSATSGLTTTEAGGQATFTIKLNSQPTANVTITLTSSDMTEGTVSPLSLIFTSLNWSTTQTVTLTGVDDYVMDGNQGYTILTTISPGADAIYNALDPPDVSVTNNDNDVAGFTISPLSGLVTTEAGGTATFTVKLTSQPTANVTLGISSGNTSEGTVSPSSLTFTTASWNTNQTVTITGVNDFVQDGNVAYTIVTAAATCTDPNYNGLNPSDVSVTNNDNDVAGISVNPTSGLTTSESGGTASFTILLTSQPTANVNIGLTSSNLNEGTVSPSSVTFTSANWNSPQTITVTGVNDYSIDGNIAYTIITAAASSTDPVYNGMNPSDVSVTNTDNDVAGITINPTSGLNTTEAGGQATFTIVLNTIPTANVTIGLTSSNTAEGTVSPSSITIQPANWNVPVTVTITGVDDLVDDGDILYSIVTAAATSSDTHYNGLNPSDVSVTNINNDVADIIVDPTSGLVTSESGTTATFTIVLTSKPTADVKINLSSDNTAEGKVSPSSVTFTSTNWNTAQTVTVTGVDDQSVDGDIYYNIITSNATSSDLKYSGMDVDDVSCINLDNDNPDITVTPTSGLTTTEAGGTATFTVVLLTKPTNDVTIPLSSSNTAEGTVSQSSLTFTSKNWDTPQTVTITGVNDAVADGDIAFTIVIGATTSTDPDYDGIDPDDVSVTNSDLTPTITLGTNPTVCGGTTTANLPYSGTTKSPNQYAIDYNPAANTAGFSDVLPYTLLSSSPIVLVVPSGVAGGTYTGTLTVRNSSYSSCISPPYTITVTVNRVTGGTIAASQTICYNGDPAAFTESVASTGNGTLTYRWESSTTNCSTAFSTISGATGTTYDPPSGLTQTTYYHRVTISTLNSVACEATSNCLTVTVDAAVNFGTLTSGNETICNGGDPANITFGTAPSGGAGTFTYQWYYQNGIVGCPAGTSTTGWNLISGATNNSYDPPSGLTETRTYAVLVDATGTPDCGVATWANSCRQVTVNAAVNFGTLTSNNEAICSNGDPSNITFSTAPSGGSGTFTYQWYYQNGIVGCPAGTSTTGWNVISGATNNSYDPPSGLTTTRTYAVQVDPTGSPDCGVATWANSCRQVTVDAVVDYGTLTSANETICNGGDPANITFSTAPSGGAGTFTYQWYYQNGIVGCPTGTSTTGWNLISGATNNSYDPPSGLTETRTYAVLVDATGTPDCGVATWANSCRQVTVDAVVNFGTLTSNNEAICSNGDPSNITFSTAPSGGAGTFTYQWYYQDGIIGCPSGTSTVGWTLITGATSNSYDPPSGLTTTRTYAVQVDPTGSPDCGVATWATNCRQVTVNALPTIALTYTDLSTCPEAGFYRLYYTGTTGSPTKFSINYDPTAEAAGFKDIMDSTIAVNPFYIKMKTNIATGTYNGSLTVKNVTTGCVSVAYPITVTIHTINATVCSVTELADSTTGCKNSYICPQFNPPFNPNNESPDLGVTYLVFRVDKQFSNNNWSMDFDYTIKDSLNHVDLDELVLDTIVTGPSLTQPPVIDLPLHDWHINCYDNNKVYLRFKVKNVTNTLISFKLIIETVKEEGTFLDCSEQDKSDNSAIQIIDPMPNVGPFN
jgi:hypothetical protein